MTLLLALGLITLAAALAKISLVLLRTDRARPDVSRGGVFNRKTKRIEITAHRAFGP